MRTLEQQIANIKKVISLKPADFNSFLNKAKKGTEFEVLDAEDWNEILMVFTADDFEDAWDVYTELDTLIREYTQDIIETHLK